MIPGITVTPREESLNRLPKATRFVSSEGKVATYFIRNNPWKLSDDNSFQKIFRFCISCGNDRFDNKKWSKTLGSMWGAPPTVCEKDECWEALVFLPAFMPRGHYILETSGPEIRDIQEGMDICNDVADITTTVRFDKVYSDEAKIPAEYAEVIKNFESLPIESRISAIDSAYFEYKERCKIEIGPTMMDTTNAFLKALAEYRQACIKILELM